MSISHVASPYEKVKSVQSDDHLTTHYSFEFITTLLGVRNTQNEVVEDEEEEGE
jgi:hypothetical protein